MFKLRDRSKHIEKQGARGIARRRVDALPWHDQGDLVRGELAEQLHQVTQAAAEAVQIVAKDDVDLPGANRLHKLIEPLARDLASGNRVSDHLDILPVVPRAILPERCELRIGGLLVGRDPCVNNDSLLHTLDTHMETGFAHKTIVLCATDFARRPFSGTLRKSRGFYATASCVTPSMEVHPGERAAVGAMLKVARSCFQRGRMAFLWFRV